MKLYTLDNQFIKETNKFPCNFTGIIEYSDGSKSWWVDGKLHRLDGPAIERLEDHTGPGHKEWWVNGQHVMEVEHNLLRDMMKLKGLI